MCASMPCSPRSAQAVQRERARRWDPSRVGAPVRSVRSMYSHGRAPRVEHGVAEPRDELRLTSSKRATGRDDVDAGVVVGAVAVDVDPRRSARPRCAPARPRRRTDPRRRRSGAPIEPNTGPSFFAVITRPRAVRAARRSGCPRRGSAARAGSTGASTSSRTNGLCAPEAARAAASRAARARRRPRLARRACTRPRDRAASSARAAATTSARVGGGRRASRRRCPRPMIDERVRDRLQQRAAAARPRAARARRARARAATRRRARDPRRPSAARPSPSSSVSPQRLLRHRDLDVEVALLYRVTRHRRRSSRAARHASTVGAAERVLRAPRARGTRATTRGGSGHAGATTAGRRPRSRGASARCGSGTSIVRSRGDRRGLPVAEAAARPAAPPGRR